MVGDGVVVAVLSVEGPQLVARVIDAVLPDLKRDDELVVFAVDERAVRAALGPTRRIEVVAHPFHELGRALAARAAGRAVLCIEDHAYVPDRRALASLRTAVLGDGVAAVVPMTNGAPWPQNPGDVPDLAASRDDIRAVARSVSSTGRGPAVTVDRPGGPVVAVAPHAVAALDRPLVDFTAATIAAAAADAGPVVTCPTAYVHATKRLPLLSAALIVKDEVRNLETCLGSLEPLVDEIVVYDTGSTDGTPELARVLGATVIEGFWDDDFARARNEVLRYCRGSWVLSIDADEQVENPDAIGPVLRDALVQQDHEISDVLALHLHNLEGSALAPVRSPQSNLVSRLFRRQRVRWAGALHEQPVHRAGQPELVASIAEIPVLLHSGYLAEMVDDRDKRERNLRIAVRGLDGTQDEGKAHFDIGRSLTLLGRHEEAMAEFELGTRSLNPVFARSALELGIMSLLDLRRHDEVWAWLDRLRAVSPYPGLVRWFEGCAHLQEGRGDAALAAWDGISDYNDRFSNNTEDRLHLMRAQAHKVEHRLREASQCALDAVRCNPTVGGAWHFLAATSSEHPDLLAEATHLVPDERVMAVLAQLFPVGDDDADRVCEALWTAHPGHRHVLAFTTDLAPRLPLPALLRWVTRFADAGLGDAGALERVGGDPARTTVERAVCLALAVDLLGRDHLRAPLAERVRAADLGELAAVADQVLALATGAADEVVVAGATDPARAAVIAERLRAHGFPAEAAATEAHVAAR